MSITLNEISDAITKLRHQQSLMRLRYNQVIADKLKDLSALGMTTKVFAKKYGYNNGYLSRIVNNHVYVTDKMARKIIADLNKALECSIP